MPLMSEPSYIDDSLVEAEKVLCAAEEELNSLSYTGPLDTRKNLLLTGPTGTGKTTILRNLLPLFFPEYYYLDSKCFNNKILDYDFSFKNLLRYVSSHPAVLFDDLGGERDIKFVSLTRIVFEELIEEYARGSNRLLCVTTNLEGDALRHAQAAIVGYAVLLLVFLPILHGAWRRLAVTLAVFMVLSIGFSRIALGVHYVIIWTGQF